MALDLNGRRLGDNQVTYEFGLAIPSKAFGNIRHDRHAGTLDLIA